MSGNRVATVIRRCEACWEFTARTGLPMREDPHDGRPVPCPIARVFEMLLNPSHPPRRE